MKFIFAPDSFKGSLSALECCDILERVTARLFPGTETISVPVADGGEGTVEALLRAMGGTRMQTEVTGPLFERETAHWGLLSDGTAVMEMAEASGLPYVPMDRKDPRNATSLGTGEMIADALRRGVRNILIGIGGSATNDGGMGMLTALGARFTDAQGQEVSPVGGQLINVHRADFSRLMPELADTRITVICDVTNPLLGENGATYIYGPQKGATPSMILQMDKWLADYALLAKTVFPDADPDFPGSGAAGGIGFAFRTFTNASLTSGIDIILEETRLESYIKEADIVVTGEGRLDGQTVMGKAPVGVAKIAKKYGKKVVAFAGCVTEDAVACNEHGIDAFFPILRGVVTLEEAMNPENARRNMIATVEQVFRLIP